MTHLTLWLLFLRAERAGQWFLALLYWLALHRG